FDYTGGQLVDFELPCSRPSALSHQPSGPPTTNYAPTADNGPLVMSFSQLHLATEHAIDKDEVDRCECGADDPPHQPYSQAMVAGGAVMDRKTVLRVTGRQHDRIKSKCCSDQQTGDVKARSSESQLLFALGICPQHQSQAGKHYNRHQKSGPMI